MTNRLNKLAFSVLAAVLASGAAVSLAGGFGSSQGGSGSAQGGGGGGGSGATTSTWSTVLGNGATTSGQNPTISSGDTLTAASGSTLTVASGATITAPGAGAGSEHYGVSSTAAGTNATGLGKLSLATGNNSTVAGNGASTSANAFAGSVCIGQGAFLDCHDSILIGGNNSSIGAGAFNIGIGTALSLGAASSQIALGEGIAGNSFGQVFLVGTGTAATAANQFVCGSSSFTITDIYFGTGPSGITAWTLHGPGHVGNTTDPITDWTVKGSSSGTIKFQGPAAAGAQTYTWPTSTGTNNYVLTTDGAGVLSWVAAAGGGSLQQSYNLGATITETSSLGAVALTSPLSSFIANTLTLTQNNTSEVALLVTSQGTGISCPGTGSLTERFGSGAQTTSTHSTAIGNAAFAGGTGTDNTATGYNCNVNTNGGGTGYGSAVSVTGTDSTVMGYLSSDGGFSGCTVLGQGITATAANEILLTGTFLNFAAKNAGISDVSSATWAFGSGASNDASATIETAAVSLTVTSSSSGPVALPLSSTHNNTGAGGSVTFNLPLTPSQSAGTQNFRVTVAQNVVIKAPNGVTIYVGTTASSAGGTWTSNAIGSTVALEYQGSSVWVATQVTGSWTGA